MTYCSNLA